MSAIDVGPTPATTSPRVVRVGGSLLEDPLVRDHLRAWLAQQPPVPNVLVIGGGPWVEAIRAAFAIHSLTERAAHWLSIRAMGLTARLTLELWPEATLLTEVAEARGWRKVDAPAIFDVQKLLEFDAASPARALPQDWSVTSDSIAAHAAQAIGASELVLLKSALPTPGATYAQAAEQGYVDRCFPVSARLLPGVRCVNLRAANFPECLLRGEAASPPRDMLR